MRHLVAATAAGTLLLVPIAAATAVPAEAATCTATVASMTITPKAVVLGTTDPKGFVVTAKIEENGCHVGRVEADLFGPNAIESVDLEEVGTVDGITTYDTGLRLNPGAYGNSEAGTWSSWITVHGTGIDQAGPHFSIKRAAKTATNATPEPPRKGKKISIDGTLERANWETLRYAGHAGKKVALQFRTPGGSYRTIKTVTSGTGGRLHTTVTASKDGCYRYVFAGSGTTAKATSKGDCIDVR